MKKKRLLLLMLILSLIIGAIPVSANGEIKQLKELPIGSIVYDSSWEWEYRTGNGYTGDGETKPVEWIIVAKNHKGYPEDSVTLLSNELIGKYYFDNSTNRENTHGSIIWKESGTGDAKNGIRKFLNGSSYNGNDKNDYPIYFFNEFSEDFKEIVLETTFYMKRYYDDGSEDISKDKVFLPSGNELGGVNLQSSGINWGYFSDNVDRMANDGWIYRTRDGLVVSTDGAFLIVPGNFPNIGIRPTLNIKSNTLVKSVGENIWEILYEKPDTTVPNILLSQSTTSPTNQNVTITVTATDPTVSGETKSGIKRIQKPDSSWVNGSITTHVVTTNGTYEFKAEDNAGNIGTKSITISNINKELPIITIEPYNTEWTNQDITVKATVDKGMLNKESHVFTENGSFTFVATDKYGNKSEETVNIINIDKIKPKIKIAVGN